MEQAPNAASTDADCCRPEPLTAGTGPGPLVAIPVTVEVFDDVVDVVFELVEVVDPLDEVERVELEVMDAEDDVCEVRVVKVELEGDGVDLDADEDPEALD